MVMICDADMEDADMEDADMEDADMRLMICGNKKIPYACYWRRVLSLNLRD